MPAQKTSLAITERYRSGMIRLRKQGQAEAKRIWRSVNPDDLDGTFNVGLLELTVSTLQREAARLSSAYLASFVASELGEPEYPPALSVWDKTFNGNDLHEGLRSAVIKAKLAIKDGEVPRKATNNARAVLISDVGLFIDTAARESLRQGMEMDDRIVGYQRALKGTCGACAGSTTYEAFSPNAPVVQLMYHPSCQCVAEPIVTGVPNSFPRPTGEQIFAGLSTDKQDEMLGPAAADLVRNGEASLADFVAHEGGFITQKPVESVKAWREEDHPRDERGRFGSGGKPKVSKWERQRKYNGWVRKLGPAEQEALARQFYEKLWKQLRAYFGAIGQPPPEMIFTEAAEYARVFGDETGLRQVQINPSLVLRLALRGDRVEPVRVLAHEWRHVFQNAELFWVGRDKPHDAQPVEQDANAFALVVTGTMKRNRRRRRQGKPLIRPKPYSPKNMAENIGKDPTTIPWP